MAATELTLMSNIHSSAQHLLGHGTAGWLRRSLKDVKDKVQSVTPAMPKLLPNAVVELTVINRASKPTAANDMPATSCEVPATKERGGEIRKVNKQCVYSRSVAVVSSQAPASEYTHDDVCRKGTASESTELSNQLLTKLHVDDSSVVSNHTCDQNSCAEFDANGSSIPGKQGSQLTAENNPAVSHAVSSVQTSPCNTEQYLPSTELEAQHCTETMSQSVTVPPPPTETRTFSADVSDSPEIVFHSVRRKTKSVKHGICVLLLYLFYPWGISWALCVSAGPY